MTDQPEKKTTPAPEIAKSVISCSALFCMNNRINWDGNSCNCKTVCLDQEGRCSQYVPLAKKIIQETRKGGK